MNGRERPTTPSRGDMSSGHPRTSAAPATRLDLLRMGFTRVRRVEHCACGTDVIQETGMTPTEAVRAHNRTSTHQGWRMRLILSLMPTQDAA